MVGHISNLALLCLVLGSTLLVLGLILGGFALAWTRERRTAHREWPRVDAQLVEWVFESIGDSDGYFALYAYTGPDAQPRRGRPLAQRGHHEPGRLGPATVLVDPRQHDRFLVVGKEGNAFYGTLAAGLIVVGLLGIGLAASGAVD